MHMLDERKTAILRAVVQEYIETAQPVGSGHVANAPGVRVSPATVRNEMAVLEQEGYLVQPHTSAGRIPTDKGYRFFVDHLAQPGRIDDVRRQQIGDFFQTSRGALEGLLSRTGQLLNDLTSYASVVVGPAQDRANVRSVQIVGLSPRHATVVVVLSNGAVTSEPLDIGVDDNDARLAAAGAHLAAHLVGHPLTDERPLPPSGDGAVDVLCDSVMHALADHTTETPSSVFVRGASSMASAFDAVSTVRQVLSALEQQYVVVSLVHDVLDRGLSVAIGAEHGVEPLVSCAVVLAPVVAEGEQVGTVGVVGPTRMNYPHALAAVDVVSERLGRRLEEG
jgi:heat-inducible transcriptional repressor